MVVLMGGGVFIMSEAPLQEINTFIDNVVGIAAARRFLEIEDGRSVVGEIIFFFITLGLELSDTKVYEPEMSPGCFAWSTSA